MNHEQTFAFPPRPAVSGRCIDLIASLVCARESRLSSKRYRISRETTRGSEHQHLSSMSAMNGSRVRGVRSRDVKCRSVYPHDAEDIKAHKWFRDIPWDQLHLITPPFVPRIASVDDTHYFDEEEPISDWSDSGSDDEDDDDADMGSGDPSAPVPAPAAFEANPLTVHSPAAPGETVTQANHFTPPAPAGITHNPHPSAAIQRSPQKTAAMDAQLAVFPRHARSMLAQFVAAPYDSTRLKRMDREIDAFTTSHASTSNSCAPPPPPAVAQFQGVQLADQMKAFVRAFGRRERKRPRDRLLRDRRTKATVLRVRKQTAFLGYTFRRVMDVDAPALATFDGAGRMLGPCPRAYLHNGMPSIAEYGALPMREPMAPPMGVVGGGGVGFRPSEVLHMGACRALHYEPRAVNLG